MGRGAEVKETHKTCVVGTNLKKKPAAGEEKFLLKQNLKKNLILSKMGSGRAQN